MNTAVVSPDHARLIAKLDSIVDLSEQEKAAVAALPLRTRSVPAGQQIVDDRNETTFCCLLIDGLAHRYKLLRDGQRQILSLHVPGDFVDLQSLHLATMDHSIGALVQSRVAFVAHTAILDMMRHHPGIEAAFWRDTLVDAAIFREWIVNLGRRNAVERIAHLICELFVKFGAVGLARPDGFTLALTQYEIADATGITPVHVNRTLKELRASGLIVTEGRSVSIPDWEALQEAAGFDPTYLHLRAR